MKTKDIRIPVIVALGTLAFFFAGVGSALAQGYVPISPLPGVKEISTSNPSGYFAQMLAIAIGVAGILAVIVIMFYGIQYMMSDSEGKKSAARAGMTSVVFGLLIIFLSWVGLRIINPDLVSLRFFQTFREGAASDSVGIDQSGTDDLEADNTDPLSPPTIPLFKAERSNLSVGESTNLVWDSKNAKECHGTGFSTGGRIKGSASISPPLGETDYVLACLNDKGIATETARVEVLNVTSSYIICNYPSASCQCPQKSGYTVLASPSCGIGTDVPQCASQRDQDAAQSEGMTIIYCTYKKI